MAELIKLSDLPIGSNATIRNLPTGNPFLIRIREMGVLPGTKISLIRRAPMGDPLEISVRGSMISLGQQEAELIEVEVI